MTGRTISPLSQASILALLVAICAAIGPSGSFAQGALPDYAAIIAAPDRSEADRNSDKRRDPIKLLAFTGVRIGMTALDMGAGCLGSDAQLLSDLSIGGAAGDECEHLHLPGGEAGRPRSSSCRA